jgi:iron complex outermembrane receptor protein
MRIILLFILLLSACLVFAQEKSAYAAVQNDTSKIKKLVDLSEIQVTAFGTPGQLKSAAGSISVIPADRLEMAAVNVASALTSVPGVVMQEGSLGTIKLTLRGVGSRYAYGTKKIKLFFGDIPMYSAEGETTFDDINPEYINRIEVLRGPTSSLYGSSLGGTLIFYPQSANFNQENIKLISSAGSYGYRKNSLSYSSGTLKNNLSVSISRIQTDGYRQNSQYSRNSFFLNQHHSYSAKLNDNFIISGSQIRAQIPSSLDATTFLTNPQKAATSWLKTSGYEHPNRIFSGYNIHYAADNGWNYSASSFLNARDTEENRPFNFLNESGFSYGGRLLTKRSKMVGGTMIHFSAGGNLYFENIRSKLTENPGGKGLKGSLFQDGKETLYQTDFFTQLEMRYQKFSVTAGLNFNSSGFLYKDLKSVDTINQSGAYHFEPILAPRISFGYQALPNVNIYTAVNKGFSVPSLSETLSPLGLINRTIKPEKAWCIETGARLSLFNQATFLDLAYYYMRVNDLIVPKRVAEEAYVGMNAGSSLHRGLEVALSQWLIGNNQQLANRRLTLLASVNYASNRYNFQDFTADNTNYSGKKLPGMPDQVFSASIDLKTPCGFYSRFDINASGEVPLNDNNSLSAKSYQTINLRAGYVFTCFRKLDVDGSFRFSNLTNTHYASMVVVNAPGSGTIAPRYFYPGMPRWIAFTLVLTSHR